MENKINILTFLSYNSTGFSVDKQQFVNNLLTVLKNKNPIVCGQEHFIQSGNKKDQASPSKSYDGISRIQMLCYSSNKR